MNIMKYSCLNPTNCLFPSSKLGLSLEQTSETVAVDLLYIILSFYSLVWFYSVTKQYVDT